jgi:hypothetical protein
LKKAFDSVNHNFLLSKLQFYGVRGTYYKLIKSYLTNRYQRVSLSSIDSGHTSFFNWGITKHGFPQGSILGPLLFLCYINDLPRIFINNVKLVLFADDTSLIVSDYNHLEYRNSLNTAFEKLNEWFNANLLSLNYNKAQDKVWWLALVNTVMNLQVLAPQS